MVVVKILPKLFSLAINHSFLIITGNGSERENTRTTQYTFRNDMALISVLIGSERMINLVGRFAIFKFII